MSALSRRNLLTWTAALGGSVAVASHTEALAAPPAPQQPVGPAAGTAITVRPSDVRFAGLTRGQNQRFASNPESVCLPVTTEQVVAAVSDAVRRGKRIAVRSGGHCYEDFVDHPDVRVLIDMTQMTAIAHDTKMNAIMVEAGAELGDVYDTLYKRWGVCLPGGSCYTVGVGGHVTGSGYGPLSRRHGYISDHVHAVEVVVVDARGKARAVVATRAADDPNRELWWAHTGGGGGGFGVVTRFWFRAPDATGTDPAKLLPTPPREAWIHRREWAWDQMTRERFARLLRNYGTWLERNSGPESPYTGLFSRLELTTRAYGPFHLVVQIDAGLPNAERLLNDFLNAVGEGTGVTPTVTDHRKLPWLHATGWPGMWMSNPTDRYKYKSSYHRKGFTAAQIAALYEQLTNTDYAQQPFVVSIASFGGKVNALPADATANPHRDSVMKLLWGTAWQAAADDDRHVGWHQRFYQAVYRDTGGVPVPGEVTDGCFINYCDIDISDPAWNSSEVPWHHLYFKENYPRLQQVKKAYDPGDVFRHSQSIRLP